MRTHGPFVARVLALLDDVPEHKQAEVLRAVRGAVHAITARGRPPGQRAASAPSTIPPWSAGDIGLAAAGRDWPAVRLPDGRAVAGEFAWRAILADADANTLVALHAALRGAAESDDAEPDADDCEAPF
jgi:hypothetical protein